MIRCALGQEAGGLAKLLAGAPEWEGWRDAYATDFANRGVTASSLMLDNPNSTLEFAEQTRLLRTPAAGGECSITQDIEVAFVAWASRASRIWRTRHAMLPDLVQEDAGPAHARLTLAGLVEHQRLWWFLPTGCADLWIAANRPCFGALIAAHAAADPRAIGTAVDSILATPAECLVRSRGGRRQTVKSIRSRLRSSAASARQGVRNPGYGPTDPAFGTPSSAFSADDQWAAKVRRARRICLSW